jgi:hypothetical protein
MIARIAFIALLLAIQASTCFAADDIESRLNVLEETLKRQQKIIQEQQQLIGQLKDELSGLRKQTPTKGEELTAQKPAQSGTTDLTSKVSGLFGGSFMTNPYISFTLNSFFYSSSTDERKLSTRGIPGYSNLGFEQKKGFNISEGELFLFAPVDPYFNLYANIPFTDEGVELEEAYFVTSSLPAGLQVKGGKFKSNFSRFNAQHPHAWDFADAPLAYRAFLGGEGLIEKGAQLTYLPPLPFYTLLGVEVLQGENEVTFNSNGTGGPHAFAGFVKTSFDFGSSSSLLVGPYIVSGQTRTETVADGTFFRGNSTLYGFEGVYKWKPSRDRSVIVQGEYLWRHQAGSLENTDLESTDRLTRSQDGMYVQSLYQMGRWRVGARYDRLSLFTDTYRLASMDQSFKNPWRLTGALEFNPSEFSRIRLQYNYDRSGYTSTGLSTGGRTNQEVYLQLILGIGAHAAHAY